MVTNTVSLGIIFGLVFGKPLGITLFSYIAVKSKAAHLPEDISWAYILGGAMLGGIGFTMSLFISDLSFSTSQILNVSKMAILTASVLSAIVGIALLSFISSTAPVERSSSSDD
jgi:NhaA family Na+:H+ antiporter